MVNCLKKQNQDNQSYVTYYPKFETSKHLVNLSLLSQFQVARLDVLVLELQYKHSAGQFRKSSSSYLFIYQVTSYHKKILQLPLGLSAKHRNMQFLQNQLTNLQSQSDI